VRTAFVLIFALIFGLSSSIPIIASDLGGGSGGLLLLGGGLALLVVLLAAIGVYAYFYYQRFLWELTQSDIHVYSGIIFKKQVHIPFQKVQSIDFQASLLERLIGIVKLKIETAGGAANKAVLIPALKLDQAEALRAEVFRRKKVASQAQGLGATGFPAAGAAMAMPSTVGQSVDSLVNEVGQVSNNFRGVFADSYEEDAPIEYEYGLSAKELLFSALSGDHNVVFLGVILGFISQLPQFVQFFGLDSTADQLITTVMNRQVVPFLIGGVVLLAILLFVFTIAATAISYGGFKCRRRGGRIEVERGLLARQYKGVAVARVQSVEIRQGLLRRLIGYAELRLKTVDSADASSQQQNGQAMQTAGLTVHPFVKLSRVTDILENLVPEYVDCPSVDEIHKLPPVAQRRAFNRLTIIPMLTIAVVLLVLDFAVLLPYVPAGYLQPILISSWSLYGIILALCIFASILWYRHAAYGYNQKMLYLSQGSWGIVTSIIPRRKIQWAGNSQNPFQRLAQVASIMATTAAGVGGTTTTLRDLPLDDADAFIDWLRPRGSH
jgi:putative membrane protein